MKWFSYIGGLGISEYLFAILKIINTWRGSSKTDIKLKKKNKIKEEILKQKTSPLEILQEIPIS